MYYHVVSKPGETPVAVGGPRLYSSPYDGHFLVFTFLTALSDRQSRETTHKLARAIERLTFNVDVASRAVYKYFNVAYSE